MPPVAPDAGGEAAPRKPRRRRRKPGLRTRIERALKWVEPLGLGIPGAGFFLTWWKKMGLNWAVALFLTVFIPISEFSLLNFAMKNGVPSMFGSFGVVFDAEDWDLHLFGLRGTARNVRIARDNRSAPVMTADEIEFNATLGALFGRLIGREQVFDEIIVRDADIRVEQSLTGDWNWMQFFESVPGPQRDAIAAGQYQTRALVLDRVRIEYLENIPTPSGGGVIQTAQAHVYADDITGVLSDVIVPENANDLPTAFELKGRSADGVVQVSGRAAFFSQRGLPAPGLLDVKLYLNNIGMGAYARTVATTSLMPVKGSLSGGIEISSRGDDVTCRSTLVANEVEFAPNPRVVLIRAHYDQLASELQGFRTSGPFDPCDAHVGKTRQTATGVLASFNTQTTLTAPPNVRAAAAYDGSFGRAIGDGITTDIANRLAKEGARHAQALFGSTTSGTVEDQGGNALTQGVKGLGRGFKRLFGK